MKTTVGLLRSLPILFAGLFATSGARAQDESTPPESAPPTDVSDQAAPAPPTPAPPAGAQVQAQGQWVNTDQYGWVWVPAASEAVEVSAQPYAYLYAPSFGWSWFVSPWGVGPYRAGPWVHAGVRAPYGPYVAPRAWYGYHGVAPHAVRPAFGAHWGGGGVHGGGRR
jgi:hypothetical protein